MQHVFNWLFVNQPSWISNVSNLTSITVLGLFVAFIKKFNCQSSKKVTGKRCWRIATHPVPGTTYRTCHVHLTSDVHDALKKDHAEKRPAQHAHLAPKPRAKTTKATAS